MCENMSAYINPNHYSPQGPETCALTCQKCGHHEYKTMLHSTPNHEVVREFRKTGWTCTKNGYRARCPKCSTPTPTAKEKA